ncbi:WD40 repeat domain-containing protein [Rhodotorula paludigena]|uniref:WD40 repeat domain-containing protein n=1 Tax=Rhodotorula paludigena TaxID=86838 RepID=UPI00316D3098
MAVPGAYTSQSDSESLTADQMADLERVAALDTDSDDSDFHPTFEADDNDETWMDEDDDEDEVGGLGGAAGADEDDEEDIQVEVEGDDDEVAGGEPRLRIAIHPQTRSILLVDDEGHARPLTAADLRGSNISLGAIRGMLLRSMRGSARSLQDDDDDEMGEGQDEEMEEEDDEDDGGDWWGPTRRSKKSYYPIIKDPQEQGMRLERGGAFGPPPRKYDTTKRRHWSHTSNVADYLRARELGFRRPLKDTLGEMTIPNSAGVEVAQFTEPVYSGQYSSDGRFFYAACKDFRVYMYDTSSPPRVGDKSVTDTARSSASRYYDWQHRSSLKVQKIVQGSANNCRWTLTDAELSDDNEWLIYSSISPRAHMVRTGEGSSWETDDHEQHTIDFGAGSGYYGGSNIWSLRFSHDAREIVAGASGGQVYVYDVEASRTILRVHAHHDDVNAVAFGSASDSNLLVSGSDDCFVKIWDRRSLQGERPSGYCVGHTEGVTFVSPKGDGRYILSNGKDQAMKLWDLRMMMSDNDFDRLRLDRKSFSIDGWDYRASYYAKPRFVKHPHDVSLMTYRGHSVLRTLIRCHFSPQATTNQRYVYSGSSDGRIHIYSLDGPVVQVLDRSHTHPLLDRQSGAYADPSSYALRAAPRRGKGYSGSTVRDVSWHPFEPKMMSTAWEETRGSVGGSIALHEWAGRRGEALEDQVERAQLEASG